MRSNPFPAPPKDETLAGNADVGFTSPAVEGELTGESVSEQMKLE